MLSAPTPASGPRIYFRSPIYFRPHVYFRPLHLLPVPHLRPAPASTSGWGQGASGKQETVLRRRMPWCTTHPLDLLTSCALGPGTMDPDPGGSFCELGILGAALRRRGRNQSWSLASSSSQGKISGLPGVVFLQARVPSSLPCQSEPGWDLGPGTRWCRAYSWTDIASNNKILRNPKGLKVTASVLQLGQIMRNKIQKEQNHNCQL